MHNVSFIMASFNCEKYIERAISSALDQSDCNVEIIIVDDASTDNTRDVLDSLTDDRIKVIKLDRNQGASHARNIAMAQATHEWISILDSDDWCECERTTQLLEFAHANDIDIVADDQRLVDDSSGKTLGFRIKRMKSFEFHHSLTLEDVIRDSRIGIVQPIFRRELLRNLDFFYDENFKYGEDYEFLVRLVEKSHKMGVVKEAYYNVTVRKDSLVANRVEMFEGMIEVFNVLLKKKYVRDDNAFTRYVKNNIRDAESTVIYGHVVASLKSGNFVRAIKHAARYSFIKQLPYRVYVLIIKKMISYARKANEKNSSCY